MRLPRSSFRVFASVGLGPRGRQSGGAQPAEIARTGASGPNGGYFLRDLSATLELAIPVERRSGNPQGLTDLSDGVSVVLGQRLQLLDLLGGQCLGSAEQPAAYS